MTYDLFEKRMGIVTKNDSLGQKILDNTNIIDDLNFTNDVRYRKGMIYDWNLNEIDNIDFKFIKKKDYSAEGMEVEYLVQFMSTVHPEDKYKNLYYKDDGKERIGLYLDIPELKKDKYEKWIVVGKDSRAEADRYNILKCNWCFEWVDTNSNYHSCVGVVRESLKNSVSSISSDKLGGSSVDDSLTVVIPSNKEVSTIILGTRFIISDNVETPRVFEVINIKDTSPLGITKLYLKRCLYNNHVDIIGDINKMSNINFNFSLPIDDMFSEFGGSNHMICNAIKSKGLPIENIDDEITELKLNCDAKYLYIKGQEVTVSTSPLNVNAIWHIFVDGQEYGIEELTDYFNININDGILHIQCINKLMDKYIVKISAVYNELSDFVEMEVKR